VNVHWADSVPFDDAAPMIRVPVHPRGGRRGLHGGDGKLVRCDEPSQDVPRFHGKCPRRSRASRFNGCGCPRCRIDAELEARQWAALAGERRLMARRR